MTKGTGPKLRTRSFINRMLFPAGWRGSVLTAGLALVVVTVIYAPAALAFPYRQEIGTTVIYSVDPIPQVISERIERADHLLSASPLNEAGLRRTLVLTGGGWRWKVMGVGEWAAIALRRPFSNTLVFNKADVLSDRVRSKEPNSSVRTFSGTIAHETVHILTARRFGELRLMRMPQWKREGYADYVANETSINPADEARIKARDPDAPVLAYYEARRRVTKRLQRNGNSVEELFSND